jgi:hypothetical protein
MVCGEASAEPPAGGKPSIGTGNPAFKHKVMKIISEGMATCRLCRKSTNEYNKNSCRTARDHLSSPARLSPKKN